MNEMGPMGFIAPELPEEFGGLGLGCLAAGVIHEEVARADLSISYVNLLASLNGQILAHHGDPGEAKPGGVTLAGTPIDLTKIKTPTFLLSTRDDHIAPWKSTYAATHLYSGPVKFVLSEQLRVLFAGPATEYVLLADAHHEAEPAPAEPRVEERPQVLEMLEVAEQRRCRSARGPRRARRSSSPARDATEMCPVTPITRCGSLAARRMQLSSASGS